MDNDWPIFGHLWLFQGRICRKLVYLDTKGRKVSPPRRNTDPRIPAEVCTKCCRNRQLTTKWVEKLQSKIYRRVCRRRKEDPPNFKHDPPTAYWERNGTIERVPVEVLKTLRHRSPHSFPRPNCERPGCPRLHHDMELSSRALEKIQRFRCLGPPAHYEFRLIPTGEQVEKIANGHYEWHDLETGENREIKSELAKIRHPRRHPPAPVVDCPDHPGTPLVKNSGPWRSSRKLRWGYSPCPSDPADHPGWTCSSGKAPRLVIQRAERRWNKNRPRRMPEAQRVKARREYKTLLPDLQKTYQFVDSLKHVAIPPDEKMRLVTLHVKKQSYKYLPKYWEAIVEELGEALVTPPKAWMPSELALTTLAKRYGYAPSTFDRKVLR